MAMAEEAGPGLEQIFVNHKDLIFRAAYRITGNASDAEDVLQTVFLRLVRQDKFPAIANLPGYLHRSAVNASLDPPRRWPGKPPARQRNFVTGCGRPLPA